MNRRKRPEKADASQNSVAVRVRATLALIVSLLIAIPVLFFLGGGRSLLMPGPLSSGHAAIKECKICHTASGSGQLSWLNSMLTRNPDNDTLACLTCHKIDGQIAFYPHTATPQLLNENLENLRNVAARTSRPAVAGLRDIAFPMDGLMNSKIYCATCHTDHKGADFKMATLRDSQCQSCHTVQFDRFDGNHPDFTNFPFKRRPRIKFDHAAHFTKHYPETASKNPAGIPDTCAECHTSRTNREHMAVLPFDQVCSTCHIDQITGVERAVGPKGLAFISLPGIDVRTLNEKGISVGEWPKLSEAELSPFMALMIGQKPEGEAMLTTLRGLDLLDLTSASDEQINAAQQLVWSIKGLLYALLSGKASDVLADLNASKGTQVSPRLISDLSANLPRDVIINAQLEWLPNLATEMLQRRATLEQQGDSWSSAITEQKLSAPVAIETAQAEPGALANPLEPLDEELIRVAQAAPDNGEYWTIDVYGRLIKSSENPAASSADPAPEAVPEAFDAPEAEAPAQADVSAGFAADTVDAAPDVEEAPAYDTTAAIDAPPAFAPIESSVDTESWAEYGGWYRSDYAIYYRPAGHKDRFIYTWLNLTGPSTNSDNTNAAGRIFSQLTLKDAQGQCIKCHSIDSRSDSGFNVNWRPSSPADKAMRFTKFVHEPHFAVMENDGCLTCHQLDRKGEFAKTYEQGNPAVVSANFSDVKKGLCVECHGAGGARDDCLLCHQYHVQDVITPIIRTQLPRQ